MRLHPVDGADARAVRDALPAALDGQRPIALGFAPASDDEVPDGTAVVVATSGSSGVPKRVILSAAALRASAEATTARVGSGQWMLPLSAAYVAGVQVLVRARLAGTDPVLLDGHFSPQAFIDATRALDPDVRKYTSLVPAQLATLLEHGSAAHDALAAYEAVLIGGQALPAPLRERALDTGVRIVRTYGSSETAGGCVYDGIPLDGVRVAEHDGELRIGGPTLATGYLGDPELTARTFVEGRYCTGDAGTVSDAGVVSVHGRIDNVIVTGGINVSLDRVERVVRGIPGLEQAVIVRTADERWGEASVVFAAGVPDEILETIRERVAAELGKPARPSRLVVVPEIPPLASGKPDREALRRMLHP